MSNTTPLNEKAEPVVLPVDLRDYFAAKAMLFALDDLPAGADFTGRVAAWAYEMADAMLKAR